MTLTLGFGDRQKLEEWPKSALEDYKGPRRLKKNQSRYLVPENLAKMLPMVIWKIAARMNWGICPRRLSGRMLKCQSSSFSII